MFDLAPGEYRVGLGESTVTPDHPQNTVHITGLFRQQDIVIGDQNLTLNVSQVPVLNKVNQWRVALVPYQTVYQGLTRAQASAGVLPPVEDIGVLVTDDVLVAQKSLQVTSDQWLLPMSYGLMKWDITVLPMVTQPVYHAHDPGIGHDFLWSASMVNADLSQYDMVVHLIPTRTAQLDENGNRRFIVSGHGAYAGRPNAFIPSDWLDGAGEDLATRLQNVKPSSGMLHESLHTFDGYRINGYNGLDMLHGAEEHGYSSQDCGLPSEWICWYIGYIRSQVGENQTTLFNAPPWNKIAPEDASVFIGVFDLMREGRGASQLWSYSKPTSPLQNVGTANCLDVAWGDTAENTPIISWTCQAGDNQLWSLKHAQNGLYQLVSKNSEKCAEFANGGLLQKTCSVGLAQRYSLVTRTGDQFAIKTSGGQCLAFSTSNNLVAETCNAGQARQSWRQL